jgi:hypothetical protein
MTLLSRSPDFFFSLCGDGGANAAAGSTSKGQEQKLLSHSYINSKEVNGPQDVVKILRNEVK